MKDNKLQRNEAIKIQEKFMKYLGLYQTTDINKVLELLYHKTPKQILQVHNLFLELIKANAKKIDL